MNDEIMAVLTRHMEERGNCNCGSGLTGLDEKCDQFDDEVRVRFKTIREFDCELVARVDCRLCNERVEPCRTPCRCNCNCNRRRECCK